MGGHVVRIPTPTVHVLKCPWANLYIFFLQIFKSYNFKLNILNVIMRVARDKLSVCVSWK